MTNWEKLKQLNEQEFADYIYSVFLSGKIFGSEKSIENFDNVEVKMIDYVKWLKSKDDTLS